MAAWVPSQILQYRRRSVVLAALENGPVKLAVWRGQRLLSESILAASGMDSSPLARAGHKAEYLVAVPDADMIETHMTLPASARSHMRDIMQYEIDRLTPFRVDEVFWSAETTHVHGEHMSVRLRLVPKTCVQPLLDQAQSLGFPPLQGIQAGSVPFKSRKISLKRNGISKINYFLCCLVAMFFLTLPYAWQTYALRHVEETLAQNEPRMQLAQKLREHIASLTTGPTILMSHAKKIGSVNEILWKLSATLPDDTYLTALQFRKRHLTFNGFSRHASQLVTELDGGGLHNAAFVGAISQSGDSHLETFSMEADLPPESSVDRKP